MMLILAGDIETNPGPTLSESTEHVIHPANIQNDGNYTNRRFFMLGALRKIKFNTIAAGD